MVGFRGVLSVFVALAAWLAVAQPACAVPAPRIDAEQTSGLHVRVRATISNRIRRNKSHLVIDQSMDGERYSTIRVIKRPARLLHLNLQEPQLPVWFRARVIDGGQKSKWSHSVAIDENFDGSEPPAYLPDAPNAPLELDTTIPAGMHVCAADFGGRMLVAVNAARASAGLGALSNEENLGRAALAHSIKMAKANAMAHDGWYEEIVASGYTGHHFGQNIAAHFQTPEAVVEAWLGSPGHRENILASDYTQMGAGCLVDTRGGIWWAQDFGG